ncbi:probable 4-coumarate--CoA ligase 1 [Microplitis mediator]|uniref:probable 4-coumarate--CoA ligase 1 n=1 Tax=Microplitis mediator TaxID=375433 RepID=UPI002552AD40|nr:probable 4-coumarate--CoA ligase 1 [Microplitis mediator]XP_057328895.1 probable 4-coumarate--CoA ligase 1 [Microplitis mediator]XP_057328896.1 probable 4-coumarate--CoA ligase 1 [Microplitis mediator]XP_057328897.1 probable 4-coumarate--CoA ligase 1 [Microplitis mediator]
MESLIRGIQRMGLVLKNGSRIKNLTAVRYASAVSKCKVIEGNNGERIFTSPDEDIEIPSLTIPEFIWQKLEKWPTKIAAECGITGRKYTYAEARDNANYIARSLRNMGLREGDVVALILPNLPESPISLLGILEAGLVCTTVNPLYTVDEISRQLRSSGAKAIITSTEIATNVMIAAKANLPPNSPFIIVEDTDRALPAGSIPFKDLLTKGKTLPQVPEKCRNPHDLAILPYSSGTTGLPKGVMLSHYNLIADMIMTDSSCDFIQVPDEFQDVIPAVLPLFHIYGMNGLMLPRMAAGAKLITLPSFTPESYINVLSKNKCTLIFSVPPIVLFYGAHPGVKAEYFKNVRCIFSGAAPLAASDVQRVYEKFQMTPDQLRFLQGYGLTECSPVSFLEMSNTKFSSIGHPINLSKVRLVDPLTGNDVVTPGQTGEIWIKGPHVMKGYHNNEEATQETLQDGWLKTGDIAYYDEDCAFFITDRLKELIKVKGFQVPPAELEAILRTHPAIADAAVVGVPDPRSGEVPKAFVVLKPNKSASAEDIQNFMKGKVSEYKELKGGVSFINEMPRNASGKILRISLKNLNQESS